MTLRGGVLREATPLILDSSKRKEFADDNFKVDDNGRKVYKRTENTVGKDPIPTVFSKGLCCRHVKVRACSGSQDLSATNFLSGVLRCSVA